MTAAVAYPALERLTRGLDPVRAELVLEQELARRRSGRKLLDYRPYRKQMEFHAAAERERALIAGNQLGKTLAASMEVAMHLTGQYPAWWTGRRFTAPTHWLAGSESGELTRRGVQRLLFGRDLDSMLGTGSIPRESILDHTKARGVPDLLDTAIVRHATGGASTVSLKSYDQGRSKWQADTITGVWFDEEPPLDVYTEGLTRTNMVMGPILLTLTPLMGMSDVVSRFMVLKAPGTHMTSMTIHDVDHYTPEQREQIIASYPEHERGARTLGVPTMGSGRVFALAEEQIKWESQAIPKHWARVGGLDFGWDHPTAAVFCAWDRDADVFYVYDCHRLAKATPAVHASAIRARGAWIPIAWPADGLQTEKGTGFQLAAQYRAENVNMMSEHATMPETAAGEETTTSRVSVEAGVIEMLSWMEQGRFKVAAHLADWFEEFRLYHRKDGKIVKLRDDLISATRYAFVMRRFAKVNEEYRPMNLGRPAMDWRG